MDDSLLEQQRAAYAVQGVDESEPVQAANKKKRKKDEYTNGDEVCHTPSTPTLPSADTSIPLSIQRFGESLSRQATTSI